MENNIEYYKAKCGCLLSLDKKINTVKSLLQCDHHSGDKDRSFVLVGSLEMTVIEHVDEITKAEASIIILERSNG